MKIKKCVLALIVAVAIMAGFTLGAGSANVRQTITATLRPDLNIEVDGAKQSLKDAAGNPVYPIVYNNSTYVPFRAVGDLLGVEVGWDQDTQTAKYITSQDPTPATKPEPDKPASGWDLIDKCDSRNHCEGGIGLYYWSCIDVVKSEKNQKIRLGSDSVDHWLRFTGRLTNVDGTDFYHSFVGFDLSGEYNTLTLKAYADYDTTVTVYNNATKDSVLGTFTVKANEAPSSHSVQINGAYQILIETTYDKFGEEDNYCYLYDAYLQ